MDLLKADEAFFRGQARAAEEAAEAWNDVEVVLEALAHLEGILGVLAALVPSSAKMLADFWNSLFSGKIKNGLQVGDLLTSLTDRTAQSLARFLPIVGRFEAAGYTVGGAEAFRQAAAEMQRQADDLKKRWPRFDDAEIDEGLERSARGEFADLSDVYHEFPELQKPAGS